MHRVLVTGGSGCLGSHVLEDLHACGVREVVVLDVLPEVKFPASPADRDRFKALVAEWIVGSVTDPVAVRRAVRGCDAVIHVASVVDFGTVSHKLIYDVNVKGTETIVAACQLEPSVKALVYASSLDVRVVNSDFVGIDGGVEDDVYAMDVANMGDDVYAVTKTIAEKAVLAANQSVAHLRTAAVRPVGIYGERDMIHIGNVLKASLDLGRANIMRMGSGGAVFQHVYARNCAHMHVLAAQKLCEGDDRVAGQAFFGIDDTKVNNFFDFFVPYLAAKGCRIPTFGVPVEIAYPLASFSEDAFRFLQKWCPPLVRGVVFVFTRRAVHDTCVIEWFNTDKARRLLGYKPVFSPMEARARSIAYFATQTKTFPQGPYTYSEKELAQANYLDDGSDFRPNAPAYLEERKLRRGNPNDKPLRVLKWSCVVALLAGAAGAYSYYALE